MTAQICVQISVVSDGPPLPETRTRQTSFCFSINASSSLGSLGNGPAILHLI